MFNREIFVLFSLIFFFGIQNNVVGQNPGIRATVNQGFLDEINNLVPYVTNFIIHNVTIPPINGSFHIPVLGYFDFWLWDINITSLQDRISKTVIKQGQIIEGIADAQLLMEAAYKWRHTYDLHYNDHGTVDIVITGVNIIFNVEVGEQNGKPTVASSACVFSISGDLKLIFHGGASWIYNDLEYVFHPIIMDLIQKEVPGLVEKAINVQAEEALSKLHVIVPDGLYLIDFSMLGPPYWAPDNSYFSFDVKGMYEVRASPGPCPFTASPLPISLSNEMLQIYLGDYFVNCAAYAHYKVGALHRVITPDDVPASSTYLLKTNTYEYIIPPLYSKYPNKNMSLEIWATQIPVSVFNTKGVSVNATGQLNASVILAPNSLAPVFSLAANLGIDLKVIINNSVVLAHLDSLTCNVSLISSEVGYFTFDILEDFLVGACTYVIPPVFNSYFEKYGVPIPSFKGFSAVNPQIVYGNGYIGAYSSIQYTPPK